MYALQGNGIISIHAPPRGATKSTGSLWRYGINFNSRPSARGDAPGCGFYRCAAYFNSRPSARGDEQAHLPAGGRLPISIHAPPRGATLRIRHEDGARYLISIHAPPRGATGNYLRRYQRRGYFNSRPSARGDVTLSAFKVNSDISIHAPPRGATKSRKCKNANEIISIHAPPRGATSRRYCTTRFVAYFNSRPSARGASTKQKPQVVGIISIHAPPRGATLRLMAEELNDSIFQFTPLREGRRDAVW